MMPITGTEIAPRIDVPFLMRPAKDRLCNTALPMETSVSTSVDEEMLKAMFAGQ